MRTILHWTLFAWIAATIWAAFYWAPLAMNFSGIAGQAPQSSRIVFFHVPVAVASFILFLAAAVSSLLYLWKRDAKHDRAALAAVEVGLVFCVLATVTGAVWSEVQWGAFWNWDPRQTSIALALLFYLAYLSLRGALEDPETRARIAAAYAVLGFVVAPFLYFVMPRLAAFSLHPTPGGAEMDASIGIVVVAGIAGYTALAFWMQSLRSRSLQFDSAFAEIP
ncbi:MAG: cytochrome c biogenesis protein CcsA [Acidobacteriota bacterium]